MFNSKYSCSGLFFLPNRPTSSILFYQWDQGVKRGRLKAITLLMKQFLIRFWAHGKFKNSASCDFLMGNKAPVQWFAV